MNKLTEADKVEIREHYQRGISKRALATMYGVARSTIHYALNDKARIKNNERNKKNQRERRKRNAK